MDICVLLCMVDHDMKFMHLWQC